MEKRNRQFYSRICVDGDGQQKSCFREPPDGARRCRICGKSPRSMRLNTVFLAEWLEDGKVSIARDPSVTGERIVGCAEWPLIGGKWSGTASVLARLYVETGIFCFQAAHEPGWMQICFCTFWLFGQARFWNAWKYFQNRNPEMNRYTDQEGIICSLLERKS